MNTSVRHFTWQMQGAPVLDRTAGSLVAVLDACLVNGFNLRAVTTLAVDQGVATVTTATAHGYEEDTVVRISGATPAGLNGDHRVLSATSTTFTFATAVPNGTASGSIQARLAPAGWQKPFSATNIGVYRSLNVESTRFFLRVDDSGAALTDARVHAFESMTGVSTGTNRFPSNTQRPGGGFWPKADEDIAATARPWAVFADDKTFYLWVQSSAVVSQFGLAGKLHGFGDFAPLNSAFSFNCFLTCGEMAGGQNTTGSFYRGPLLTHATFNELWVTRAHTQLQGAVRGLIRGTNPFASSASGASSISYPNPADNGLLLSQAALAISNESVFMGYLRGISWVGNNITTTNDFRVPQKMTGSGALAGKKFCWIRDQEPWGELGQTPILGLIDLNGPWD